MGAIACQADGGCAPCAVELILMLQKKFPEHAETFGAAFRDEFEYSLEGDE